MRKLGNTVPDERGRPVRGAVVAVVALVLLATFLIATGESVDARGPGAVLLAAWWLMPFAVYSLAVATYRWSWLGGGVLMAASFWALVAIYRSDSSTAGLGFVTAPMLLMALALIIVVVDHRAAHTDT